MTAPDTDEDERLAWWKADALLTEAHDAVTRALAAPRTTMKALSRLLLAQNEIELAMAAQREGRPK